MPPSYSAKNGGGYYEDGRYSMFNYHNFKEVFDFDLGGCYTRKQVDAIEGCRKLFEGLFVDKVLKLVGVKRPRSIYPPKNRGEMQELHAEIVKGEIADHLKLSLLFYILLDCGELQVRKKEELLLEDRILKKFYLPSSYELLMKGLWYMDRGEFSTALQYLTHPSLTPTFEDDILETLVRFSGEDLSLALAYYHTVQPALKTSTAVECLFKAMATASVTQAFFFSRSQPENVHKQLFETLIKEVFRDNQVSFERMAPGRTADEKLAAEKIAVEREKIAAERKGDRSVELINMPFTVEEEEWFEEFLTYGEGRSLRRAADTVMMRKIGTGRFAEALKLVNGTSDQELDGVSWDRIVDSVDSGLGPRLKMAERVE